MAAPTITTLPAAPVRGEDRSTFATKSNTFVDALAGFVTESNALGTYVEGKANDISEAAGQIQDGQYVYAADTGTANAYVISLSPSLAVYVPGGQYRFKATNTNTGASTLNIDGLGAIPIYKNVSTDLVAGDIKAGEMITVVYDGVNFQAKVKDSTYKASVGLSQIGTLDLSAYEYAEFPYTDTADDGIVHLRRDDAATSGYEQAADGSRWIISLFKPSHHVTPEQFGAKGDGTTDDTASIQGAMDYIENAGGGVLLFRPGKSYRITYSLLIGSNIIFDMQGSELFWDCPATATEASAILGKHFQVGDDATYSENIIIRNIVLRSPSNLGNGIGLGKCRNVLVQNIRSTYIWLHTVDTANAKNCVIDRIYARCTSQLSHVQVDSTVSQTAISGADSAGNPMYCAFDATAVAVWSYSDNITIQNCDLRNNQYSGIHLHNQGARRIFIKNNVVTDNLRGIHADDGGELAVVWIESNFVGDNTEEELYLQADIRELHVINNTVGKTSRTNTVKSELVTMRGTAIDAVFRTNASFMGNKFYGTGMAVNIQFIYNLTYKDNHHIRMGESLTGTGVEDAASCGATIYNCRSVTVSGSQFYDCILDACLRIHACDRVSITDNMASGSGSLVKALDCTRMVSRGNIETPLAGVMVGSHYKTITNGRVESNSCTMDLANNNPAHYFDNCTQTIAATNNLIGPTTGVGMAVNSCPDLRTINNAIRAYVNAIEVLAGDLEAHERYVPAVNIINSGVGTITYTTFTTAAK